MTIDLRPSGPETLAIPIHRPNPPILAREFQASMLAGDMHTVPTPHSDNSVSPMPFQPKASANLSGQSSAAGMATAMAHAKPSNYVAKEDWIRHRKLIAQLYENQTLAEVMEYMETRHGFRATIKMYKTHIKKYGLDKKSKEHEMRAIARKYQQRAAQGNQSIFRVRGRIVDYEDVIRYWKRKGLSVEAAVAQPKQSATSEPVNCGITVSPPMTAPKEFAIPESIFATIGDYCKGSFESGTWVITSPEFECRTVKAKRSVSSRTYELTNACVMACELFANHEFEAAGRVLISANAGIRDILSTEHPSTLRNIFRLIIYVRNYQRPEIALAILRQYSALGEIVLGDKHPLRRICGWLASVDSGQFEEVLSTCLRCIGDYFESLIGPMHFSTLRSRTQYIKEVHKKADIGRAGIMLRTLFDQCELALGPYDMRTLEARLELAYHYLGHRNYVVEVEWRSLEIITLAQQLRSRIKRVYFRADALWLLGNCQYARNDIIAAESSIREAINLRASEWGEDDSVIKLWRIRAERLPTRFNSGNVSSKLD